MGARSPCFTPSSGVSYWLLACDLDGTLVQDNGCINVRVGRAISLAKERGVQVALVTGRSFQSALPYARLLDIRLPLVCYQGGLIKDPETGETLHRVSLEREVVEEAIDLSQARGWQLILYTADKVVLSEFRYPEDVYRHMLGPTVTRVEDLKSAMDGGPIKLTIMAAEDRIPAIEAEMRKRFVFKMEVFRSHPMFVEAVPRGASKGSALAWLAEHLGVPQDAVMAIGDQDNDASMLTWAGLGVAMGNGSPQCRSIADWIAPTIHEDGGAVAIERFLLHEVAPAT
jgi:Cof subfamily protein (haloacid dehalogenase superfamily)